MYGSVSRIVKLSKEGVGGRDGGSVGGSEVVVVNCKRRRSSSLSCNAACFGEVAGSKMSSTRLSRECTADSNVAKMNMITMLIVSAERAGCVCCEKLKGM